MAPEIEEPNVPAGVPVGDTVGVPVGEAGDDTIEDSRMTLSEHLQELRGRLFRGAIAFVVAFVVLYMNRGPVQEFIQRPHAVAWEELHHKLHEGRLALVENNSDIDVETYFTVTKDAEGKDVLTLKDADKTLQELTTLGSGGPFFVAIRICFYLSLFIAGPIFLWEIWMFIAAGLYKREKRVVYMSLPPSLLLFLAGNVFGFYFMVPAAIYFTQADGLDAVKILPRIVDYENYFQFLRSLTLALGVIFQLPIFQVALSRTGLVNPATYAKYRGHTAILALVLAAIITPPDPFTQVLLAGPTMILWEIGYWVSRLVWKEPDPELAIDDEASAVA